MILKYDYHDKEKELENTVVQFPDLTELLYTPDSWTKIKITPEDMKTIKTEFVFFVKALSYSPGAIALGFKEVTCMNNWFHAHRREHRRMTFYWMRNPYFGNEPVPATRFAWGYGFDACNMGDYHPHVINREKLTYYSFLAASGCGFNIGEPPFVKQYMYQFHTLMRMPVEVPRPQAKELVEHGYRLLDTGKQASYWINGWKPEEYSVEKENKYFGVDMNWNPIEKKEKVVSGNRQ